MTDVNVVSFSGDALGWVKVLALTQLALGLALLVVLVAIAVTVFWRRG